MGFLASNPVRKPTQILVALKYPGRENKENKSKSKFHRKEILNTRDVKVIRYLPRVEDDIQVKQAERGRKERCGEGGWSEFGGE